MPPGYPAGENLWAVDFWLIVEENHGNFGSFRNNLRIVKEILPIEDRQNR